MRELRKIIGFGFIVFSGFAFVSEFIMALPGGPGQTSFNGLAISIFVTALVFGLGILMNGD